MADSSVAQPDASHISPSPVPPGAADLHMHSTVSDGTRTPTEVVERAAYWGLTTIALTDHDTVGGFAEAHAAGERLGVEVLPGCELSTLWREKDIHILGLFIDPTHAGILRYGETLRVNRLGRAREMARRLEALGTPIDIEAIQARVGDGSIGRPHIARALVDAGHAVNLDDAFARYIGNDCEAYIPKQAPPPAEAIDLIHEAGGVAVMAHPLVTFKEREPLRAFLYEHADTGALDGMEVFHPSHTAEDRDHIGTLARNKGMVASGGSDCHGPGGPTGTAEGGREERMGSIWLDPDHFEALRDRAAEYT